MQPSGKMALLEDSLSFSLDEKLYVLEPDGQGFGNRQVNVKPYDEEISGRSYAYLTGNKFWYGSVDSTLYHAQFGFTTFSSIMMEPKSLAPPCRQIWATAFPTVNQEAWIFRMFGSMIRDKAIIRMYSSPVTWLVIPRTRRSRVPSSWNGHGMNAVKP